MTPINFTAAFIYLILATPILMYILVKGTCYGCWLYYSKKGYQEFADRAWEMAHTPILKVLEEGYEMEQEHKKGKRHESNR